MSSNHPGHLFVPLLGLVALSGCSDAPTGHSLTLATLYSNTSAESAAACQGVYRSATSQLPSLIAEASHTAATEQSDNFGALPPAIILDVDETVLDNSPFEVRLIQDGGSYPTGWDEWCNEAAARPIAGALAFTQAAADQGVTVFYVTNRKEHLKDATHRNLVAHGFPMKEGVDTLLMRDGKPEWTSDKTTRRAHVAAGHRIVMLFGDNTGDFLGIDEAHGTVAERRAATDRHLERWGYSWFMLPNPMYGYWDGSVLDYNYQRPAQEIQDLRVGAMDGAR